MCSKFCFIHVCVFLPFFIPTIDVFPPLLCSLSQTWVSVKVASGDPLRIQFSKVSRIYTVEFQFDGFSRDVCRSMVALMDVDMTGKLGLDEFIQLWKSVRTWKVQLKAAFVIDLERFLKIIFLFLTCSRACSRCMTGTTVGSSTRLS